MSFILCVYSTCIIWYSEMEDRRPDHRYSWIQVDPTDPDPRVFSTRSYGPTTSAPYNQPHMPTYETYRPLRPDAPEYNAMAIVEPMSPPREI